MNRRLKQIDNWTELAASAQWSLKNMAAKCQVSVRGLELHFKKTSKESPKKWLVEQRMRLARGYLEEGFLVKEVAAKLGYKRAHHLSRDFKKYWGVCPTYNSSVTPDFRVMV